MNASDIKIRDFRKSSYGIFENGNFISSGDGFEEMKDRAAAIAKEGVSTVTIATIRIAGTDEEPNVVEGTVIMKFYKVSDTIYIVNELK